MFVPRNDNRDQKMLEIGILPKPKSLVFKALIGDKMRLVKPYASEFCRPDQGCMGYKLSLVCDPDRSKKSRIVVLEGYLEWTLGQELQLNEKTLYTHPILQDLDVEKRFKIYQYFVEYLSHCQSIHCEDRKQIRDNIVSYYYIKLKPLLNKLAPEISLEI